MKGDGECQRSLQKRPQTSRLWQYVDEVLRILDARQFTEERGEVCPVNWTVGDEGMKPTADDMAEYLAKHAK